MNRRAFLFAIPAVAVLARPRPGRAFMDFGKGTPAMLHGGESILPKIPPCDVCGRRMTNWKGWTLARDAHEIEPDKDGTEAWILGALHVGCHAHPAKAVTYRREGIS